MAGLPVHAELLIAEESRRRLSCRQGHASHMTTKNHRRNDASENRCGAPIAENTGKV
jgi:hypothetical protein